MHPTDLVPELDAAVTPAARPPPTPAAARTGEPTPSPCRPRSPPPGPAHRRPAHPRPWNGGCRAPQPPMPPPRTTRPWRPGPGGPLALRRIPPGTWTVTPRLDILTQAQRRALRHLTGAAILDDDLPASRLPGKAAPTPICGHSPAGPPPKPNSRKPACPTASTARTKSTSATTTKFSLRYSDDGHIARELGEPPSAGPAHNISGPRCRGQAGYPRVSTRAGPVATLRPGPGRVRAGPGSGRRAVAVEARPGPARAGPRVGRGPITTDARPVRQPGTMNAAPGEPLRARNLSGCQDQPPDLLLLWRRGAVAVMSVS